MRNQLAALALAASAGLLLPAGSALATPIEVSQGGVVLGIIDAYTGVLSGADNYVNGGDPANGPAMASRETRVWFYNGSDGLNFNVQHHIQPGDCPSDLCEVDWDITVTGSTTNPGVRESDDPGGPELEEIADTAVFEGRWNFDPSTDGGVIGEIGGLDWVIDVDPIKYVNMSALKVYRSNGTFLSLNLNTDTAGDIRFRIVSEPATLALLGLGLAAFGARRARV